MTKITQPVAEEVRYFNYIMKTSMEKIDEVIDALHNVKDQSKTRRSKMFAETTLTSVIKVRAVINMALLSDPASDIADKDIIVHRIKRVEEVSKEEGKYQHALARRYKFLVEKYVKAYPVLNEIFD